MTQKDRNITLPVANDSRLRSLNQPITNVLKDHTLKLLRTKPDSRVIRFRLKHLLLSQALVKTLDIPYETRPNLYLSLPSKEQMRPTEENIYTPNSIRIGRNDIDHTYRVK